MNFELEAVKKNSVDTILIQANGQNNFWQVYLHFYTDFYVKTVDVRFIAAIRCSSLRDKGIIFSCDVYFFIGSCKNK